MLMKRSNHRKMVHRWARSSLCWIWCLWCFCVLMTTEASRVTSRSSRSFRSSSSLSLSPSSDSRRSINGTGLLPNLSGETVCPTMHIRNSVQYLKILENCTVVEGNLEIALFDHSSADEFINMSYPKLKEVTGYFFLYRVEGLTTLAQLFPNLAVIRGQNLFHNFALVIYEMRTMYEVGLVGLTAIVRGSVLIQKNPHLCYVDTVDWDKIAIGGRGGHLIKENKEFEQCPNNCPSVCAQGSLPGGKHLRLCWTSTACQKTCSPACDRQNLTCSSSEFHCCHQECLGGCHGRRQTDCSACRHVAFEGKCVRQCPPNTYEFAQRRCLTESECRSVGNEVSSANRIYWKFIPYLRKCLPQCPAGYTVDAIDKHKCYKCAGQCPKICGSAVVESVASAQKLKGCTVIDGSLEIQIHGGGGVIHELEASLSTIQEIKGYLKIARSYSLVSLNFLRNLNYIRGETLDRKLYALLVLDNQNLQELWDWSNRLKKLEISRGKVFFHFNSKLCLNKVEDLKKYAVVSDWDDRDVSPSSNGDRVTCNVIDLPIDIWAVGPKFFGLKWKSFKQYADEFDFRSLLGYVLYYREAPDKNVTKYDGRDACGSDVWKVDDIDDLGDGSNVVLAVITGVKPFTTYAVYVRTYTIASALLGGESDILYFTTKPDTPSPPANVRAHATSSGEIVVSWSQPKKPNGNITHYIVDGLKEKDLSEFVRRRNYCNEPLILPKLKKEFDNHTSSDSSFSFGYHNSAASTTMSPFKEITSEKQCCSCSKNKQQRVEESEAEFHINFEDFLLNAVYIKK